MLKDFLVALLGKETANLNSPFLEIECQFVILIAKGLIFVKNLDFLKPSGDIE